MTGRDRAEYGNNLANGVVEVFINTGLSVDQYKPLEHMNYGKNIRPIITPMR
ncbi:MAG: hypothetical protein JRM72_03625 [Nitrososphaerota archaeon]|nr:hypothetical protein [Nitrososphaerota archaeon]MDG7041333.1 hypothetical protein [Nitrososphaerota archaeon]MDG7041342.1 hypothetical protein [Nitrososphaerota archaeon]MDG7043463.1 hypothetical protein [Nitrososphaerota archaeon]MDG7043555.1 hypothetical protein [Nitrososphaerota archaeon]